MPKLSRGGRRATPQITQTTPVTQNNSGPRTYTVMTDTDASKQRTLQDSMYDANVTSAIKLYISNTNFDGNGYSLSQTMNHLLDNGADLKNITQAQAKKLGSNLDANRLATVAYTDSYMRPGMHNLGKDTLLQRGAHDDLLQLHFGIKDYSKYTDTQLTQMLVGKGFTTKSYLSTSYDINKNPFLSSSSGQSGGREIVLSVKAKADTKVVYGAKKQSEIIIDKGTNFQINSVRYNNKTAYPRAKGSKPQLEIEIEVI